MTARGKEKFGEDVKRPPRPALPATSQNSGNRCGRTEEVEGLNLNEKSVRVPSEDRYALQLSGDQDKGEDVQHLFPDKSAPKVPVALLHWRMCLKKAPV